MRWKALAEIYTMHSFAPCWNPHRSLISNFSFQKYAEISRKLLFFQTDFFAKILRLQRCKKMQILENFKNAVERIFCCKIWLRYSRERARQTLFAKFAKKNCQFSSIFPILLTVRYGSACLPAPDHAWVEGPARSPSNLERPIRTVLYHPSTSRPSPLL